MNRVQAAIAKSLGVTEELEHTSQALEAIASDYTMLQRQLEDVDYLNLWDLSSVKEVLPNVNDAATLRRLRRLRNDNPLAKQGVKLIVRFTLGKGIQWLVKDNTTVDDEAPAEPPKGDNIVPFRPRPANEAILEDGSREREALEAFWGDPENQMTLTSHSSMQTWLDENVTDGEKFLVIFESEGVEPYVRLSEIPLEEIKDILYDPSNRKRPVWYKRVYQELVYNATQDRWEFKNGGTPTTKYYRDFRVTDDDLLRIEENGLRIPKTKIGEGKIQHWMVNALETKHGKRGISELYASREWFRVFREFMQDRAAINAAATALAYKRKIKGGPASVASFTNKFGGLDTGGRNAEGAVVATRKLTRPVAGATYDSNEAADLEWNKTDTGATNAKEDARMLLMSAGAGMSTNIHYFGEGGDANLATAQAMELPMVKSYEDWQKYFETNMMALLYYVLKVAFGDEYKAPKDIIVWEFPPIISKDIVKIMTAWSTLITQVAKDNTVVRKIAIRGAISDMGVAGVDQLMKEIEAEEKRLEAQKAEQRQMQMDQMQNPEKTPIAGFAKANAAGGGNPDIARAQRGKPPVNREGRKSNIAGS
jgi:hypothetical protein